MAKLDISDIVVAFITAGVPGFFSYWYLDRLNIVYSGKDSKEDKVTLTLFFSFFNMIISIFIFYYLVNLFRKEPVSINNINMDDLVILFIISLFVCFLMTMVIYPEILKYLNKSANDTASRYGLEKGAEPLIVRALLDSPKAGDDASQFPFVYIFDFNEKLIGSGYWKGVDINTLMAISLISPYNHDKDVHGKLYTYVSNQYNTKKNMVQIIDFDKQFKIYISYPNDELPILDVSFPKTGKNINK